MQHLSKAIVAIASTAAAFYATHINEPTALLIYGVLSIVSTVATIRSK